MLLPEINFQRTPVTLIIAALAFALEVVSVLDPERRMFHYNELRLGIWLQVWQGEVWRPFTTTLLHGSPLHALFNIFWLVRFGSALENWFGPARMLLLIVLLAFASSMAQYTLTFDPSYMVGLSGVMYGLFGMVWIGRRYVSGFQFVCDDTTVRILLAWFLIAILITNLGLMNIANVAHGAGLVFGVLYGLTAFQVRHRWTWGAISAVATVIVLATLVAAPWHPHYQLVARHRRGMQQLRHVEQLPVGVPIRIELRGADDLDLRLAPPEIEAEAEVAPADASPPPEDAAP